MIVAKDVFLSDCCKGCILCRTYHDVLSATVTQLTTNFLCHILALARFFLFFLKFHFFILIFSPQISCALCTGTGRVRSPVVQNSSLKRLPTISAEKTFLFFFLFFIFYLWDWHLVQVLTILKLLQCLFYNLLASQFWP